MKTINLKVIIKIFIGGIEELKKVLQLKIAYFTGKVKHYKKS